MDEHFHYHLKTFEHCKLINLLPLMKIKMFLSENQALTSRKSLTLVFRGVFEWTWLRRLTMFPASQKCHRVNTWLRSTIPTKRLSDLAVISMNGHAVSIDRMEICRRFMAAQPRRTTPSSLFWVFNRRNSQIRAIINRTSFATYCRSSAFSFLYSK